MDSGSGSSGRGGQGTTVGRHRRAEPAAFPDRRDAALWTPISGTLNGAAPDAPAHAAPVIIPPGRDPLVDTGPPGLHSFNLGSIPASVTPPRSWRRAAWFMIFSSAAALMGLLFVASTLVAPRQVADRVPMLPDLPTGPQLIESSPAQSASRPVSHAGSHQQDGPGSGLTDVAATGALTPSGRPATGPMNGTASGAPATSGAPGAGTAPAGPPSTTTVTGGGPPAADPGTLAQRTQAFFRDATTDVQAAVDLTVSTVRDEAAAMIARRYSQIATIQVQSISLDPENGLTISVLKITNRDGTTSTQQTTLRFSPGGDPLIENPGG